MPPIYPSMGDAIKAMGSRLRYYGYEIATDKWQGIKAPKPMWEILEMGFRAMIPKTIEELKAEVRPNLPWADMHFEERVSGIPYNPPPSAEHWPFNRGSKGFRSGEVYTHTYPERFWPKYAGSATHAIRGIRFSYGDLNDVVDLLRREPFTRQAFLPVWFPEDTGAVHGGRVPCTIGYWFVNRYNLLHCTYYIRSCDYFRHLRDDIYLAARLVLWMLDQLEWTIVQPGFLNMYIGSLHCWTTERELLPK